MSTTVEDEDREFPDVIIDMTAEEFEVGVQNTLEWLGCTREELLRQGRRNRYDSARHRWAWVGIGSYLVWQAEEREKKERAGK